MANIASTAIRKRIREVVDDGAGLARTVSAGRISGDYWEGSAEWAGRGRTLTKPRFDIPTFLPVPNTPGAMELGSFQIYVIQPVLVCEYDLGAVLDTDDNRDAARATAEQDADVLRQALGWAGNLTTTAAGTATGILDGYLRYEDGQVQLEEWEQRRLITRLSFHGFVKVTTAV